MPLIDRGALMEELRDMLCSETMSKHLSQDDCFSVRVGIKKAMQMVGNAPTIDPVRHGRWIGTYGATCNLCGYIDVAAYIGEKPSYCPSCGAKMDGGRDA